MYIIKYIREYNFSFLCTNIWYVINLFININEKNEMPAIQFVQTSNQN